MAHPSSQPKTIRLPTTPKLCPISGSVKQLLTHPPDSIFRHFHANKLLYNPCPEPFYLPLPTP